MFNKLKQFKDMRDQGKQMKAMMDSIVLIGGAHSGKLMVTINGSHEILGVEIDPSLDHASIASGFKIAMADAQNKLQKELMSKMQEMGGMEGLKNMMGGE